MVNPINFFAPLSCSVLLPTFCLWERETERQTETEGGRKGDSPESIWVSQEL